MYTPVLIYKGHGKMARLTAKLFYQCPTLSASKGKVFIAGGSCQMVIAINIHVIRMGISQQSEYSRILWREDHYALCNARWVDTLGIWP
jgi:hypothetical protein